MKVLVIIPAYNEELNIKKVVSNLIDHYPQYNYVVVNDGSADSILSFIGALPDTHLLRFLNAENGHERKHERCIDALVLLIMERAEERQIEWNLRHQHADTEPVEVAFLVVCLLCALHEEKPEDRESDSSYGQL